METKERLMQAAIQCFLEYGYEKASISKITNICNVTKGAFYHHFKNKDEIYLAALQSLFYEIDKWLRERIYASNSFREMLDAAFDIRPYLSDSSYISGFDSNHYAVFFDAIKRFPEINDRIRQIYEGSMYLFEERVSEAQRTGEIKNNLDPKAFALHFYILVEGLMFFDTFVGRMDKLEEDAKILKENLWNLVKK